MWRWTLAAGLLLSVADAARASWCTSNAVGALFCEDFDQYSGELQFEEVWVPTGPCASWLQLGDRYYASAPTAGLMNTQETGLFGYSVRSLASSVRDYFGSCNSSSVTGSDLDPLVLDVVINGEIWSRALFDNSFITLGSGYAVVPADWVFSDWCTNCGSTRPHYPIVCQQETAVSGCAPISTAPAVPAIAVGFLAYLDPNPCHCNESTWHSPTNEHLSFFDGTKWYRLRQGLFPGSGEFRVRNNENRIRITIYRTTIKVELTCPDNGEYSWCLLPSGYTGPFNRLSTGVSPTCELQQGTWTCAADRSCTRFVGVPNAGEVHYDNIVLDGGVCDAPPGACCMPDTTCTENAYCGDCQALGGQCAAAGSTCSNTACCPPLWADHDRDNDVDVEDFGWIQTCLSEFDHAPAPTVACGCADLNHDNTVDMLDVALFIDCLIGPSAAPGCGN